MTARQRKLARKRRIARQKKIDKAVSVVAFTGKCIGIMIAAAVFLILFVAVVEENPTRTVLLLEVAASYCFTVWLVWVAFYKGKEDTDENTDCL